jgi:hypothetical protein
MDTRKFLVKIGEAAFVTKLDESGKPLCVGIPSVATHMRYDVADELCQILRAKGYWAVVSNVWGEPCYLENIERALSTEQILD